MRVGIDAYLLHGGEGYRAAGVSVYTHQLLRHLPLVDPINCYVAMTGRDAPRLGGMNQLVAPVPTKRPLVRVAWEQTGLPLLARRLNLDVLHGAVNVLPAAYRGPSVVTIHDLAFLRHPERFPAAKRAYLKAAVLRSARRATHVCADSAHTKDDLVELGGLECDRVSVVYPGVEERFHPLPVSDALSFRRSKFEGTPYLLYVGTLEPRKNVDILIRAFARLRSEGHIPHVLALVGGHGWGRESLFDLVRNLGLEGAVRFIGYVPAAELPLWYNGADLFAYPSAYEGFGLPLLEAMACGTVAITSESSSLRELASGACLTVEPGSEEALFHAMTRTLEDANLRHQLRDAGLRRAARFSWWETARAMTEIYGRVAREGRS